MPLKHYIEFYFKGLINAVLIFLSLLDTVDVWIRVLAGIAGVILTILLAIKAYHDIKGKKLDNRLKQLQVEREDQELYERRKLNLKEL